MKDDNISQIADIRDIDTWDDSSITDLYTKVVFKFDFPQAPEVGGLVTTDQNDDQIIFLKGGKKITIDISNKSGWALNPSTTVVAA